MTEFWAGFAAVLGALGTWIGHYLGRRKTDAEAQAIMATSEVETTERLVALATSLVEPYRTAVDNLSTTIVELQTRVASQEVEMARLKDEIVKLERTLAVDHVPLAEHRLIVAKLDAAEAEVARLRRLLPPRKEVTP